VKVVDVCEVVYDDDSWLAYFRALGSVAPRYLTAFAGVLGVSSTDPRDISGCPALTRPGPDHEEQLAELAVQVLHGGQWEVPGGTVNDRLAAYVVGKPKLRFWAGLDLAGDPLAEAKRSVDELGATGLSLIPFLSAADITDRRYDGLWDFAQQRALPVWVHCGQHFRSDWPVHLNGPAGLDTVSGRFPEVRMVAGHGGWPWVEEMLAVAARHDHVYLELSSHRPARLRDSFAALYSGVHPVARRRVVFGSASWTQGQSPRQLADAVPGDEAVLRRWLHENALTLVGGTA
jgi:predicted TIM-barrel fold metal-dependent hydrolase